MKIIKQLVIYNIAFLTAFIVIHYTQNIILKTTQTTLRFQLWETNLFFAVVSLLICVHIFLFSYIKPLQSLLGFIYLPTLLIKGALFYLRFKDTVFTLETFTLAERINLLIPSLLFLILEVYFVAKQLDKMPK